MEILDELEKAKQLLKENGYSVKRHTRVNPDTLYIVKVKYLSSGTIHYYCRKSKNGSGRNERYSKELAICKMKISELPWQQLEDEQEEV